MKTRHAIWLATSATVALGAVGAFRGDPRGRLDVPSVAASAPPTVRGVVGPPERPRGTDTFTATVVPPAPPDPRLRDEASLMRELRRLGENDPPLSLQLAREGNVQFPESSDAAERTWTVVKSLVNMNHFDAAKVAAAAMVEKYRGTALAADVERHLLVNPL